MKEEYTYTTLFYPQIQEMIFAPYQKHLNPALPQARIQNLANLAVSQNIHMEGAGVAPIMEPQKTHTIIVSIIFRQVAGDIIVNGEIMTSITPALVFGIDMEAD